MSEAHSAPRTAHTPFGLPTLSWINREPAALLKHARGPFTVLVDDFGRPDGPVVALTAEPRARGGEAFLYVAACEPNRGGRLLPLDTFAKCSDELVALLRGSR